MAVKKKVTPYDPYKPFGNHSLPWFQQQANLRATNDTNAQVAALPSSQFYTDSASQLAKALSGIQGQQSTVAAAGSPLYQQAFDSASSAANKAALAGGGTGVAATPGGGSLVGALGATMAQALSGGQSAAVARGRNDVIARAGQESAIRAKQPSAAAAYLKEMTDQALQARVAQFNQQLASSQLGLDASNTAFDNQLAADSLAASTSTKSNAAKSKSAAALAKAMATARKAANEARKGTKSTTTTANDYTFNVPNSAISGDPSASGTTKHVIRAKDGPGALVSMTTWLKSLPTYDASTMNPKNYFSGEFKPITSETTTAGSRSAQLHAALGALMDAGYDRATALKYARQIIGSKVGTSKKKKQGSTATSSQSR